MHIQVDQRGTYNEYKADGTRQTPDEQIARAHPATATKSNQQK